MANSAFDHSPTITVPSSTVNNRVVTWNGTTGKVFNNTALVTIDAGVVAGVTALTVDNLTIDGNTITSTDTNGNITLTPNGSGSVVVDTVGNSEMSFNGTVLDLKNNGTQSSIKLYCETGNTHYQEIRGGPHSGATSYTMILPHEPPTATQVLTTASISSNVAVLDWADTASSADDTAYASSWNGVTTIPPSKNAVYDKIETITAPDDTAYASSWNGVTTIAPSKNAVYDKIESMGSATAVGWRVHWDGDKSVNSNSNTSMNWNVESGNGAFDAGGFHTNGSNDEDSANAIITVPSGAAGVYVVTTTVNYQANNTTGKRNVSFAHTPSGGSTAAKMGVSLDAAVADDGAGPHLNLSMILNLGVGDTLAVRLWHTQGSALIMSGDGTGGSMHFAGIKISDAP